MDRMKQNFVQLTLVFKLNLKKKTSNPNFDLMRQHVLRDPRLLQQLANVSKKVQVYDRKE